MSKKKNTILKGLVNSTHRKETWKMIYELNADLVFEIAVTIEKNGAEFYRNAAEKMKDPRAKKMLIDLAKSECDHEQIFNDIRSKLVGKEKETSALNTNSNAAHYLKALADTRVFFKKDMPCFDDASPENPKKLWEDILIAAIRAEKDSIVFYVGIKDLVPEAFGKPKVDEIIQEEMLHLTTLSQELSALKG
jgi:rubrerythrin